MIEPQTVRLACLRAAPEELDAIDRMLDEHERALELGEPIAAAEGGDGQSRRVLRFVEKPDPARAVAFPLTWAALALYTLSMIRQARRAGR